MSSSNIILLFSKLQLTLFVLMIAFSESHAQNDERKVKVGETFEIELPSNQSTGFSWHYMPNEKSLVDSVKVSYEVSSKNAVGVSGIETWEFLAKEKGQESLLFEYKRSWENIAPAKTKTIHIKIE